MALVPNRPTGAGRALGAQMARLVGPEIDLLAAQGEPDDRCSSCAFRAGTWPNGCEETVMDALKCALEDRVFACHMPERRPHVCFGWYAWRVGVRRAGGPLVTTAPWPYADEPTP